MPDVTLDQFRRYLNPGHVRVLAVLHAALAMGTIVILGAFVFMIFSGPPRETTEERISFIQLLTVVVLLLTVTLIPVAGILFRRIVGGTSPPASAEEALTRIRSAYITRMAMLEGAALFGLVVILLAGIQGVLEAEPIYWVNLFPWLFFLAFVAATFPTLDRIVDVFRMHMRPGR